MIRDCGQHTSALGKCPALAQETVAIVEEPMSELLAELDGSSVSEGSGSAREASVASANEQCPQSFTHAPVDPNPLDPRTVSSRVSTKEGSSGENFSNIS